jgi:hypothetical protein
MRRLAVVLVICLWPGLGCSGSSSPPQDGLTQRVSKEKSEEAHAPPGQDKAEDARPAPRKLIYTAQVDLTVVDFDKAVEQLNGLVEDHKGYRARFEIRGDPGSPRAGDWTVGVPAERFDSFLAALGGLGELRRSSVNSDDVTDKYYDLDAHLKTNQVEEEGLRKMYADKASGGRLEDLLALRRELRGIRGTIEEQQGQLKRWDKETEFSTVTLHLSTRSDYVPPSSPSFGANIGRTFLASLESLASFGRGVVLGLVAVVPWLAVVAVAAAPFWLLLRRRPKPAGPRASPAAAPAAAPPPP